jgi:hypothetical protein
MTRLGLACAKGRKIIKRPRTAIKCFSIALELCLGAEKCFYSERHKNKAMKASGQTALEYMLIIVVAIIVVVTLLIFMQGVSTSTISTNTKGLCEATRCKSDIDCVVDACIPFATHCSPLGSCFIDAEFGGGSAGGGGGGAGSLPPEVDGDGDGIPDVNDNCPCVYNPDQTESLVVPPGGGTPVGEACDITRDGKDDTKELGICTHHFALGNNLCSYYMGVEGELKCVDGFVDTSGCGTTGSTTSVLCYIDANDGRLNCGGNLVGTVTELYCESLRSTFDSEDPSAIFLGCSVAIGGSYSYLSNCDEGKEKCEKVKINLAP